MVFTDKINIVMHHSSQGMLKKNILSKSLNVEVFKSTIGILLIFFFLVVSSRFVEYFNQAAEGLIDPNIIFKVIFLRFPDFVTLLIPLSFFLGVVITISRMYADREIYGYFTGNLSQNDLIKYHWIYADEEHSVGIIVNIEKDLNFGSILHILEIDNNIEIVPQRMIKIERLNNEHKSTNL